MRRVKIITGLKTEDVFVSDQRGECVITEFDPEFYTTVRAADGQSITGPKEILARKRIMPIHHICEDVRYGRRDWYICYSEEVQRLLEIPFDVTLKRTEQMESFYQQTCTDYGTLSVILSDLVDEPWWKRVLRVFTGFTDVIRRME